jgi:hypothetical protein
MRRSHNHPSMVNLTSETPKLVLQMADQAEFLEQRLLPELMRVASQVYLRAMKSTNGER